MFRLIFISFLLMSVLSMGLPFNVNLPLLSYDTLRMFGLDVAMTPFTVDMYMMMDKNNIPIYKSEIGLRVYSENGVVKELDPQDLDLHLQKVPLNLYYELLSSRINLPETKFFICKSLKSRFKIPLTGFELWSIKGWNVMGVGHVQFCEN